MLSLPIACFSGNHRKGEWLTALPVVGWCCHSEYRRVPPSYLKCCKGGLKFVLAKCWNAGEKAKEVWNKVSKKWRKQIGRFFKCAIFSRRSWIICPVFSNISNPFHAQNFLLYSLSARSEWICQCLLIYQYDFRYFRLPKTAWEAEGGLSILDDGQTCFCVHIEICLTNRGNGLFCDKFQAWKRHHKSWNHHISFAYITCGLSSSAHWAPAGLMLLNLTDRKECRFFSAMVGSLDAVFFRIFPLWLFVFDRSTAGLYLTDLSFLDVAHGSAKKNCTESRNKDQQKDGILCRIAYFQESYYGKLLWYLVCLVSCSGTSEKIRIRQRQVFVFSLAYIWL